MVALRTVHLRRRRLLELTPAHFSGPAPVITFEPTRQRTRPMRPVQQTNSVSVWDEKPAAKARLEKL